MLLRAIGQHCDICKDSLDSMFIQEAGCTCVRCHQETLRCHECRMGGCQRCKGKLSDGFDWARANNALF